jgi:choline dehydrogenase-like flavoprotein
VYCPRGKTLGGCSSINAMIYQRGNPGNYDYWAAQGNQGWSYSDLLPLFKRLENFEPGASAYHGAGGPLNVADLRDPNPLSRAFLQACQQVALPLNDDNGAAQKAWVLSLRKGRSTTQHRRAYPGPFLRATTCGRNHARHRLRSTQALHRSGLFAEREVVSDANREVIVSSGAINSPQL